MNNNDKNNILILSKILTSFSEKKYLNNKVVNIIKSTNSIIIHFKFWFSLILIQSTALNERILIKLIIIFDLFIKNFSLIEKNIVIIKIIGK